jgi:hypothetical protein
MLAMPTSAAAPSTSITANDAFAQPVQTIAKASLLPSEPQTSLSRRFPVGPIDSKDDAVTFPSLDDMAKSKKKSDRNGGLHVLLLDSAPLRDYVESERMWRDTKLDKFGAFSGETQLPRNKGLPGRSDAPQQPSVLRVFSEWGAGAYRFEADHFFGTLKFFFPCPPAWFLHVFARLTWQTDTAIGGRFCIDDVAMYYSPQSTADGLDNASVSAVEEIRTGISEGNPTVTLSYFTASERRVNPMLALLSLHAILAFKRASASRANESSPPPTNLGEVTKDQLTRVFQETILALGEDHPDIVALDWLYHTVFDERPICAEPLDARGWRERIHRVRSPPLLMMSWQALQECARTNPNTLDKSEPHPALHTPSSAEAFGVWLVWVGKQPERKIGQPVAHAASAEGWVRTFLRRALGSTLLGRRFAVGRPLYDFENLRTPEVAAQALHRLSRLAQWEQLVPVVLAAAKDKAKPKSSASPAVCANLRVPKWNSLQWSLIETLSELRLRRSRARGIARVEIDTQFIERLLEAHNVTLRSLAEAIITLDNDSISSAYVFNPGAFSIGAHDSSGAL